MKDVEEGLFIWKITSLKVISFKEKASLAYYKTGETDTETDSL